MAHPEELVALIKAFSGLGLDENSLISYLGKSHPEYRKSFRKATPHLFIEDERSFERWNQQGLDLLRHEFVRFENAVMLWAMHPWERDARLIHDALREGSQSYDIIVEVACTRSSGELLGARKAYHSLFDRSIEEDVATHVSGNARKLLVALVSAYRYEGSKVKEEAAKLDAKKFANAIRNGDKKSSIEDDEVIRILTTRSKPHIKAIFKHYKEVSGKSINEDLLAAGSILKQTVECFSAPDAYFCKVSEEAMKKDANHDAKKALTRVIVTQADDNLKQINEQYNSMYGISLSKKVEETANGNYKDFLLALITREN